MNNWERMKAGRLYNADSKDLEKYHSFGMETCDKFNRTPLWMKKRKQRLLEKTKCRCRSGKVGEVDHEFVDGSCNARTEYCAGRD